MTVAGEASLTLLEDIETSRKTLRDLSYREILDIDSPGSALASRQFYEIIDARDCTEFEKRLMDCRSRAWFVVNKETGKVRVAAKQCRLRWCYHCSEARQQFITAAVLPWFQKAKKPKLLTLTLRHNYDPLEQQIHFLYKSFIKLRSRKYLKSRIQGGVWFFQITWNDKTNQWHPHLHILLDSEYLDHGMLMHFWEKITDGSKIVHIRLVNNPETCLAHNARYAARPSALVNLPKELWPDMFDAFNHRRICGCFGNAKEISLRPEKPEDSEQWQSVGGFKTVTCNMANNDDAAMIFECWRKNKPLPAGITMIEMENFIDGATMADIPPPDFITEPYFPEMWQRDPKDMRF